MQPRERRMPGHPAVQLSPGASWLTMGMHASIWAALPALAGLLLANAAHAQSSGNWYYCDPAHAYYPYVRTCSGPWRSVVPNPNAYGQSGSRQLGTNATPSLPKPSAPEAREPSPTATATPNPSESMPSVAFRQGQVDRQSWEAWFDSLTGDDRAGADYWASHRSLPNPGSCSAAPASTGADWTAGCVAAQQRLAAADVRRKTEPEYRLGWNNPPPIRTSLSDSNSDVVPAPVQPAPTPLAPSQATTAARADNGIAFGIAKVIVAVDGAYICQNRDQNALNVANDPNARERMGDLNYMQVMIRGGCFQLVRGETLTIYALSENKRPEGVVVSPLGKIGRMGDFTDWYGKPLAQSSLHRACHTSNDGAPSWLPGPPGGTTSCGLEY